MMGWFRKKEEHKISRNMEITLDIKSYFRHIDNMISGQKINPEMAANSCLNASMVLDRIMKIDIYAEMIRDGGIDDIKLYEPKDTGNAIENYFNNKMMWVLDSIRKDKCMLSKQHFEELKFHLEYFYVCITNRTENDMEFYDRGRGR